MLLASSIPNVMVNDNLCKEPISVMIIALLVGMGDVVGNGGVDYVPLNHILVDDVEVFMPLATSYEG